MKIVILDGYVANPGDLSWQELAGIGDLTVYDRTAPDDVIERCRGAAVVFTNKVVLDSAVIGALPDLKFIGVLATGYNNVDIAAACQRGITVCNVPAYSTESVAQLVFALLLELTNRVGDYDRAVAAGGWQTCHDFSFTLGPIYELSGRTIGIYGLGNIGRRVACIANAFGMRVISPTSKAADAIPDYVTKVTFDEMLELADVISVNAPLDADNRGLFGRETLSRMRQGALLINTARGPLVDEQALADALRSGRLGGAAVDVLCEEPPRQGSPLIGCPRCLITPHIAWQSVEARRRLIDITTANLQCWLAGRPQNVVR
ncbi:MAG: D-2-hydroxyacid dehydrogenase [Bacteroidales bacterium]|nr:D-2-hydroxyacid dehydrogenase [Bacteroidales bacterium]